MIKTFTYPNGLTIVVESMQSAKTISCIFEFNAGAVYEKVNESGIAHLIEHLLFAGTTKRNKFQIRNDLDNINTIFNANTTITKTRFYIKNIVEFFEPAFEVYMDILQNSTFSAKNITKEKSIVKDEIIRYKDINHDVISEAVKMAYYKGTGYDKIILGTSDSLDAIKRSQIVKYYKSRYTPNNLIISFAGNIKLNDAKSIVEKYLTKEFLERENTNFISYKNEIYMPENKFITVNKQAEQCQILLKMPAPNCLDDRYFATNILVSILGGDASSRLFRSVREKNGLVYNINCFLEEAPIGSSINIYFATAYSNVVNALEIIKQELNKIIKSGITETELKYEKQKLKISLLTASEDSLTSAVGNGIDFFKYGRCFEIEDVVKAYEKVTIREVKAVAKKYLGTSHLVGGILGDKVEPNVFSNFEINSK